MSDAIRIEFVENPQIYFEFLKHRSYQRLKIFHLLTKEYRVKSLDLVTWYPTRFMLAKKCFLKFSNFNGQGEKCLTNEVGKYRFHVCSDAGLFQQFGRCRYINEQLLILVLLTQSQNKQSFSPFTNPWLSPCLHKLAINMSKEN